MDGRGSWIAVLVVALAVLTGNPGAAEAGFCEEGVVHDYEKPLKRLPEARRPPIDEHLSFAPGRVFFQQIHGSLLIGSGDAGYRLSFSPYEGTTGFSPLLGWVVTTRIARVDRRGTTIEIVRSSEEAIERLRSSEDQPSGNLSFSARLTKPGLYSTKITFRDRAGQQLAQFEDYLRLLRPRSDFALTLNRDAFHPGERVSPTLENRGTEWLSYGLAYGIEAFDGSAWRPASIQPHGPFLAIGLGLGPGGKSSCWNFEIPADAPAGLYRFTLSGDANRHLLAPNSRRFRVHSEFTILPG